MSWKIESVFQHATSVLRTILSQKQPLRARALTNTGLS